jgi:hypothetical protein
VQGKRCATAGEAFPQSIADLTKDRDGQCLDWCFTRSGGASRSRRPADDWHWGERFYSSTVAGKGFLGLRECHSIFRRVEEGRIEDRAGWEGKFFKAAADIEDTPAFEEAVRLNLKVWSLPGFVERLEPEAKRRSPSRALQFSVITSFVAFYVLVFLGVVIVASGVLQNAVPGL